MRDVLGKMRECGKDIKMRDFPHDGWMVDAYILTGLMTGHVFMRNKNVQMNLALQVFNDVCP